MRTLVRLMSALALGSGLAGPAAWAQDSWPRRDRVMTVADGPSLVDVAIRRAQAPPPPATPAPATPAPAAPATPAPAPAPLPATPPAANPTLGAASPNLFGNAPPSSGGLFDTSGFSSGANPIMIGDAPSIQIRPRQVTTPGLPNPFPPGNPPPTPDPRLLTALASSVRALKIAENQSPKPQDRVFFSFNYFTDLNGAVNRRLESPIENIRVYRYVGGLEKTYDEGRGSFGFRLPLNSITADPAISGNFARPGGTSTSLGDLSLFTKYVLKSDPKTGSLVSAGLEITLPTGPANFAGANFLQGLHSTQFQPFVGYLLIRDRFYLHGFTSLSVPTTLRDATFLYNDVGIGYAVYRDNDPDALIRSVVPTFEVHVNNPLTHRNPFDPNDLAGSADAVNLTYGVNVALGQSWVATFGLVTPVATPRPFNTEYLFLLNYRFGKSRRPTAPLPLLSG